MSVGTLAAEHRQTCRVRVVVDYSAPDLLDSAEVYPGPTSKPGHRGFRRLEWHSGVLSLASRSPVIGSDVKELWAEIGETGARQMYRDPLVTMLIPLVRP
jgi:hypothetical protein